MMKAGTPIEMSLHSKMEWSTWSKAFANRQTLLGQRIQHRGLHSSCARYRRARALSTDLLSLLKSCRYGTDTFSILISHLANLSFTHATFLSKFRLLSELHWLISVRHRINFKILQFQQPSYLAVLIPRYVPTRSVRFSSSLSLYVFLIEKPEWQSPNHFHLLPRVVWNKTGHLSSISTLPAFRKRLKHHLF